MTTYAARTSPSHATDPSPGDEPKPPVSWRHHYVPCFLLATFTPSGRKTDKLWSFDNERARPVQRTPKAVAFEPDFYAVDVPGQPSDLVEGFFGRVETVAAPIVRTMVADRALPTGQAFADLMFFLGLMFSRSKAFRDLIIGAYEGSARLAIQIAASSRANYESTVGRMPEFKDRLSYEAMQVWAAAEKPVEVVNASAIHAQAAVFALEVAPQLLAQRKWSLHFASDAGVQFACSDNPVSLVWSTANLALPRPPGLVYTGTDFVMPVHRTAALVGRSEGPEGVHEVDDRFVGLVNGRTAASARRYVFASTAEFHVLTSDHTLVAGSPIWLRPSQNHGTST